MYLVYLRYKVDCYLQSKLCYIGDTFLQTCEELYVCVTHLHGVYCGGVFVYLHVMTNFVYVWAVYCFGVCGTFSVSVILIIYVLYFLNSKVLKQRFCVRIICTY